MFVEVARYLVNITRKEVAFDWSYLPECPVVLVKVRLPQCSYGLACQLSTPLPQDTSVLATIVLLPGRGNFSVTIIHRLL